MITNIRKMILALCLAGSTLAASAQSTTEVSLSQKNGYYFFLGPQAGSQNSVDFTYSQNNLSLWAIYDYDNSQLQEVDITYTQPLYEKNFENKTTMKLSSLFKYWMYPRGSDAGATNDIVLQLNAGVQHPLTDTSSLSASVDAYYLADKQPEKNGFAFSSDVNISQTISPSLQFIMGTNTTFGAGLYEFQGHLNSRLYTSVSLALKKSSLDLRAEYQFSGKDQVSIDNVFMYGLTYTRRLSL